VNQPLLVLRGGAVAGARTICLEKELALAEASASRFVEFVER